MTTWAGRETPPVERVPPMAWPLVVLRGGAMALVMGTGLALLLLLRLVEQPIHGVRRPWTPWITQGVCRTSLAILGIGFSSRGRQMREMGAVVANHASWLDILALNARKRVYFVSKAEVANWPGIGLLARATGTVFIRREAKEARLQQAVFEERLRAGHKLLFFPEGTSTDGLRVLQFKSTLFAAFFTDGLREEMRIQPVTVIYRGPKAGPVDFYGWWGAMGFGPHLLKVLARARQGRVEVVYHEPLRVADFADRKALARAAERAVRSALPSPEAVTKS